MVEPKLCVNSQNDENFNDCTPESEYSRGCWGDDKRQKVVMISIGRTDRLHTN